MSRALLPAIGVVAGVMTLAWYAGASKEVKGVESFSADSSERCFACGCAGDGKGDNPGGNELIYCELCEDSWCDCCREPSCADKHEWYFCTRNAAESFSAEEITDSRGVVWRTVAEYPYTMSDTQHEELMDALDEYEEKHEIKLYVSYGDTVKILTNHPGSIYGPDLPIFSAESETFESPASCNICGKTFDSFLAFDGHYQTHFPSLGKHRKRAESFSAQEGDKCPYCYCEHENLSVDSQPPYFDGEQAWVEIQCDDCNMKATAPTYDFEFDKQGILEEVGLPIAVNMENPNYGTLRCSRCYERIVRAAESFAAEHPSGEGKLKVSGYEFADGALMVGVGTEDLGVDDPDFVEMMIDKDGQIDYFSLPIGEDGWDRTYNIKPSHYGKLKTEKETNKTPGGDFDRFYAESFPPQSPCYFQCGREADIRRKLGPHHLDAEVLVCGTCSIAYNLDPHLHSWKPFGAESFSADYEPDTYCDTGCGKKWVCEECERCGACCGCIEGECQVEDCEGTPCPGCGLCDICEGGDINACCARRTYRMRKGWGAESFGAEENEMCPSCDKAKIDQDHNRYLVCPLCDWRSDEQVPCRHLNIEITDTDYAGEYEGGVIVYASCEDCGADLQAFGVWEE